MFECTWSSAILANGNADHRVIFVLCGGMGHVGFDETGEAYNGGEDADDTANPCHYGIFDRGLNPARGYRKASSLFPE